MVKTQLHVSILNMLDDGWNTKENRNNYYIVLEKEGETKRLAKATGFILPPKKKTLKT